MKPSVSQHGKMGALGAVLRCNAQGIVIDAQNQELFDDTQRVVGHLFSTLFDAASVEKALKLMTALETGESIFTQEIDVLVGCGEPQTVFISGFRENGVRVFLLSPAPEELFDLYAELMQINNEQANFIRSLSKQQQTPPRPTQEEDIFWEFSSLNNDLANAKRELTKKNMVLEQLNTELQYLNAEKDKFFSIIAHDLKSPFNALLGFSALLESDAHNMDRNKIAEYAKIVHQSGENAFKLIENLLEWARIQMGRVEASPEPFELADSVQRSLDALGGAAAAKHIQLTSSVGQEVVYADPNMVDTAIRNLVNNAIKFTANDGHVAISAAGDGNTVVLSITDNGVGIPAHKLSGLFKMSEATSTSGTNGEAGTGLGILLCKELIERNGGALSVKSTVGEGTTFSIVLPCTPII